MKNWAERSTVLELNVQWIQTYMLPNVRRREITAVHPFMAPKLNRSMVITPLETLHHLHMLHKIPALYALIVVNLATLLLNVPRISQKGSNQSKNQPEATSQ